VTVEERLGKSRRRHTADGILKSNPVPLAYILKQSRQFSSTPPQHPLYFSTLQSLTLLHLEVEPSSIIIKSIDNYSVAMVTFMHDAFTPARSDNN
jgi:hypothetical protein